MGKNSAAKIAANNRYDRKTYDRFNFRVRKEEAEQIKLAAAAAGVSVNSFILEAVREKISGSGPPEIEREPFFD
jgi:predicted HicB family RNase H-like nuclease